MQCAENTRESPGAGEKLFLARATLQISSAKIPLLPGEAFSSALS